MEGEENNISDNIQGDKKVPGDFGKVVEELHNKTPLPTLRTYQGDTAEFIKSKNESVISINTKEREKKREDKIEIDLKMAADQAANHVAPKGDGIKINITIIALSLLLLGGGGLAAYYIYTVLTGEPTPQIIVSNEIIPINNMLTLANSSKENFATEFQNLSYTNGVNLVRVSDANGTMIQTSRNFFNLLAVTPSPTLERTLKDYYFLGAFSDSGTNSLFIILTVNDYGIAFSGMLDWEENMEEDFAFFAKGGNPLNNFVWKDLIVKNKDTRALVNTKGIVKIAYTFLDKNTILITNDLSAIGTISGIFASRDVAR